MRIAIIILTLAIILPSCEGAIVEHGHVYDKSSRLPLGKVEAILILNKHDTVRITNANGRHMKTLSNDSGYFEVTSGIIGMITGYPEYRVLLLKNGYLPLERAKTNDSIFLEKK